MQAFKNKARFLLIPMLLVLAILSMGCGARAYIPPGEVAVVLEPTGYETENIDGEKMIKYKQPGAFRLQKCAVASCERLIRLQLFLNTETVIIDKVTLPKSKLVDIDNVQISMQYRVKDSRKSWDRLLEDIKPIGISTIESDLGTTGTNDRTLIITSKMVWETYLERIAPMVVITELKEHTVEELLSNVQIVADNSLAKLNASLADKPVEIVDLGFPNGIGEPHEVVLDAKRRLYAVDEEKAREIAMLEADLEVEEHRQKVYSMRARNDRTNAEIMGIDPNDYMRNNVLDRFAEEGSTVESFIIEMDSLPENVQRSFTSQEEQN
jgi:hypothetical protein